MAAVAASGGGSALNGAISMGITAEDVLEYNIKAERVFKALKKEVNAFMEKYRKEKEKEKRKEKMKYTKNELREIYREENADRLLRRQIEAGIEVNEESVKKLEEKTKRIEENTAKKIEELEQKLKKEIPKFYKVYEGINALGEHYFGSHKTGYIAPGLTDDYDNSFLYPQIDLLNKKLFIYKFMEQMENAPFSDDVGFSDAYRHAGLINIYTLEVVDPATFGIELRDHVFTWPMIETLPKVLKGTPFIAIHADTEGGLSLLFPLASGMDVNHNHEGGYRKSMRRHHRKTLRHYKKKSSHRKGTRRHGRRTHRN